jgi:hypothetical protein
MSKVELLGINERMPAHLSGKSIKNKAGKSKPFLKGKVSG